MTDLPPIEYLDEAAKAATYRDWQSVRSPHLMSVIAHARALHQLAQARAEIAALKPCEALEQVARREAERTYGSEECRYVFKRGFLRGVQMQREGVLPDE